MAITKLVNLVLNNDRVIVQQSDAEEKTQGGIIIPDTAKDKPTKGVLKIIGAGSSEEHDRFKRDFSVGDEVLYGKYAGTELSLEDEEGTIKDNYIIMRSGDIIGKDSKLN